MRITSVPSFLCKGAVVAAGVLAFSGCATMKPGLGFDGKKGVQQSVSERTGKRIHWNNGSAEDKEVAAALAAMLERELTAEDAIQVALLNNHELQAVYEELDLAQADLVQAGLLRNPVLSGEVRFGFNGAGTGVVVDATQDFISLLYIPLRKGRAEAAFAQAKLRVTAAVVDLAAEVGTAFYEYQAAEQTREMRQTVLDATGASYELAKRLRTAGNNRDLDLANERNLHEQAKVDLALAEEDVLQSRERLNALMGVWGNQTQWKAGPRLAPAPQEEFSEANLETRAIESSLDLAIARREIEIAARSLGIAQPFAWLTDLEAGVAAERELEGAWSVGPSVSLPIPLFDQGQVAVGRARAQLRQAGQHYYARAVEIRSRARAAGAVVASARDRARYYQQVILPLRQQIVDETQLQYNGMQVSAFQLLESKRNQIEAGASYIEALRDYWVARTQLEQILSGRLTAFEGKGSSTASAMPHSGLGEEPARPLQHRHTGTKPVASPE